MCSLGCIDWFLTGSPDMPGKCLTNLLDLFHITLFHIFTLGKEAMENVWKKEDPEKKNMLGSDWMNLFVVKIQSRPIKFLHSQLGKSANSTMFPVDAAT